MILRHATPKANLASIQTHGILASKAQGKRMRVWAHSPSRSEWAVLHTVKRHDVRAQDVVVIEVEVPRQAMRRTGKRGIWNTATDIAAARFVRVLTFEEIAASPEQD